MTSGVTEQLSNGARSLLVQGIAKEADGVRFQRHEELSENQHFDY